MIKDCAKWSIPPETGNFIVVFWCGHEQEAAVLPDYSSHMAVESPKVKACFELLGVASASRWLAGPAVAVVQDWRSGLLAIIARIRRSAVAASGTPTSISVSFTESPSLSL